MIRMKLQKPFTLIPLLLATWLQAAVSPVPVSLRSTVSQYIGKTNVSIEYSRPNAKGREVYGELTPYGEVWRTGANVSTSIEFDTTVSISGTEVPAGRYSLFTIPQEDKWTVIINTVADEFGAFTYKEEADLFRFEAPVAKITDHTETFQFAFANVADNKADIQLSWQNTVVSFPISVTEESNYAMILAEIQHDIIDGNDSASGNYGEAARFYVKHEIDLEQATQWYDKCHELRPDSFWLHVENAQLLIKLNRKDEASTVMHAGLASATRQESNGGINWINGLIKELDL